MKINHLNPFRFAPGDKVLLINDHKRETFVVEHLVFNDNALPLVSKGPMGQLVGSLVYRVRSEMTGHISDFRSDSLELKNQTAVEKKISKIKQKIKEKEQMVIDFRRIADGEEQNIVALKYELERWEKTPEHTV